MGTTPKKPAKKPASAPKKATPKTKPKTKPKKPAKAPAATTEQARPLDYPAIGQAVASDDELERIPPDLAETLSPRQRLFVEHFLGDAKLNATKAARLAGYKEPANQGYRLRHFNPLVRAYIEQRLSLAAMPADEVLYRLASYARASLEPFLYEDDYDDDDLAARGTIKLNSDAARRNAHLLKEVSQTILEIDGVTKTTTKIKIQDPLSALKTLAAAHGMLKGDSDGLQKIVDVTRLTNDQLRRYTAGEDLLSVLLNASPDEDGDAAESEAA